MVATGTLPDGIDIQEALLLTTPRGRWQAVREKRPALSVICQALKIRVSPPLIPLQNNNTLPSNNGSLAHLTYYPIAPSLQY